MYNYRTRIYIFYCVCTYPSIQYTINCYERKNDYVLRIRRCGNGLWFWCNIIIYLSIVFCLVFVSTICRQIVSLNHDIVTILSHTIVNPFVYIHILCYAEKYSFNHYRRCMSYSSCSIRLYTTESTKWCKITFCCCFLHC